MEARYAFFSIETNLLITKSEAQSVLRFVAKNKKPRLYIDRRFHNLNLDEHLKSAVGKIKTELDKIRYDDRILCVRFTLSVIECLVLYQTLRDIDKDWASFFLHPAVSNISRCSSIGFATLFRCTEKKKLLDYGSVLAMHITNVLNDFKTATGKDLLDYETFYDD